MWFYIYVLFFLKQVAVHFDMYLKFNTGGIPEMQTFMLTIVYYCIDDIHYEFKSILRIDFF